MNHSVSIGARLREERAKLNMNQSDFAALAGVTKKTQMLYESGERAPDTNYMAAIAAAGADALYILTGQGQGQGISEAAVYKAVLEAVDLLSLDKKVDAQQLARATVKLLVKHPLPKAASNKIHIGGDFQGQILEGKQLNLGTVIFGDSTKRKE